jgi:micrococcal nuclease
VLAIVVADRAGLFTGAVTGDDTRYQNAVCTITYVSDGDTFDIDIPDGRKPKTRIRLWGVDCPEIAHGPDENDAWFGREAADFVQEHFEGRRVRIALDPNRSPRDKYGRLLAYVYADENGEMLNEQLVEAGLAYADQRFDHIFKHRFVQLEKRASKARNGLWEGLTLDRMPAWRQRMVQRDLIGN